jgi:hypothetical protein
VSQRITHQGCQVTTWRWEIIDGSRSASTGSVGDVFGNESRPPPGYLAANPPSPDATLFAREVIQNSWDAAIELQDTIGRRAPKFHIDFEFRTVNGPARAALIEHLDLRGLRARADEVGRTELHLSGTDCLDRLDEDAPMRVLIVTEHATTGMYGPFDKGPKSKMFLAMLTSGFTPKAEGAGGSYGYGKAGLVLGSEIRSVIAYTRFEERDDDPGVTRRLLGVTYWAPHEIDDQSHTGFARLGAADGDPLENNDADAFAEHLGLTPRLSDEVYEVGTTFLLVDPTIEPYDLCKAIERSWWPAIVDELFTVAITDDSGDTLVPQPRQNPDLSAFISASDFLGTTTTTDGADGSLRLKRFAFNVLNIEDASYVLGDLVLVADPASWTFPAGDGASEREAESEEVDGQDESRPEVAHKSLVALIRGPRMVVEYSDRGQTPPFIRGVFLASHEVDDFLRQTEPKGHDRWQTEASHARASHPHATRIARSLHQRIDRMVRDYRRAIAPPPVEPEGARLDVFDILMSRLLRGRSKTRPPIRPKRPISISFPYEHVVPGADGLCRLKAAIRLALSEHSEDDSAPAAIHLDYAFVSDAPRTKDDRPGLDLELPQGMTAERRDDGVYVVSGSLERTPVTLSVESEPYPADWTGELKVTADLLTRPTDEEPDGD